MTTAHPVVMVCWDSAPLGLVRSMLAAGRLPNWTTVGRDRWRIRQLLRERQPQFSILSFSASHCTGHRFWHLLDPDHQEIAETHPLVVQLMALDRDLAAQDWDLRSCDETNSERRTRHSRVDGLRCRTGADRGWSGANRLRRSGLPVVHHSSLIHIRGNIRSHRPRFNSTRAACGSRSSLRESCRRAELEPHRCCRARRSSPCLRSSRSHRTRTTSHSRHR